MNPKYLIIASIITALVAYSTKQILDPIFNSNINYALQVEERLTYEIQEQEYQMIPNLDSLSIARFFNRSHYSNNTPYPYYIFRSGKLQFWSDYHYVPEYKEIFFDGQVKYIETSTGSKYIARKWKVDNKMGEFEVYTLIPLYYHYQIDNRYLESGYASNIFESNNVILNEKYQDESFDISYQGERLMSVQFESNYSQGNYWFNWPVLMLWILAAILAGFGGVAYFNKLNKNHQQSFSLLLILLYWLSFKVLLAYVVIPSNIVETKLFDPKYFAVSWFEGSFAEMILNTFFITLFTSNVFRFYPKLGLIRKIIAGKGKKIYNVIIASIIVMLGCVVFNYTYLQIRTIYFNSNILLDITASLESSMLRILSYLIFVSVVASTFFIYHVLISVFSSIIKNISELIISVGIGSFLFILISIEIDIPIANLLLINLGLWLMLYLTKLYKQLIRGSYRAALYLVLSGMVMSLASAYSILKFEQSEVTRTQLNYAKSFVPDSDHLGEFLLDESVNKIIADPFISSSIHSQFLSKDAIVKKIEKIHLSRYLDKYELSVYVYGAGGKPFRGYATSNNYHELKQLYGTSDNQTEYDNIYFVNNIRSTNKRYLGFIPIRRFNAIAGYIVLELKQKKTIPSEVFPELLVDSRILNTSANGKFNYGIFINNELLTNSGDFDYNNFIVSDHLSSLKSKELFKYQGYYHAGIVDYTGKVVVVSVPDNDYYKLLSNFSFLFLLLISSVITVILLMALANLRAGKQMGYTSKIQTYFNIVFIVPLIVISITTLSLINNSFKRELENSKLRDVAKLTSHIGSDLDEYLMGGATIENLEVKLSDMARYAEIDINLYSVKGVLIASTQSDIFKKKLLAPYINPKAYNQIVLAGANTAMLPEQVGELNYYSTYAGITTFDTGRLIGILSIPVFESESTIEENQIFAFTTILNIFAFIFIFFLSITFMVSKWLAKPMVVIAQKIKRTTFSEYNEPLEWETDDEIGLLVGGYNEMLLKLEDSKQALARSEKESAWREIAQQVAHEIKNPLTPMKLTIQKLQRSGKPIETLQKSLSTLLTQVDTLNDIAASFSEFAKMPMPRQDKIDLVDITKQTAELFNQVNDVKISLKFGSEEAWVLGDAKLMSRIISNMILNASQSATLDQDVVNVAISLVVDKNNVVLKVSDNGGGIPEEIKEKVFMPKFSTKSSGSGIGLAIAKHGIENAGGKIWFESETNKGTTFVVEFPIIN